MWKSNNNIFADEVPTPKLIDKWFRYTDDITLSKWNLAYYLNKSYKNVSSEIKKLESKQDEYEIGIFYIFREFTKSKTCVCNVGFTYKTVHVGNDGNKITTLNNVKTHVLPSWEIDKVSKNLLFAWCSTCHSA